MNKHLMPNVFVDFHHASLLNSLIMLFEGRLGGKVYRPIGIEWAERGFWKVYDHPATQAQFLGIGGATPDGSQPLNDVVGKTLDYGQVYHCLDIESDQTNKAITLEAFWKMPIDFVVASIPQHIYPFRRLCEEHPNKPKLIYQIGNAWAVSMDERAQLDGVMASAKVPAMWDVAGYGGKQLPVITYHQEFDLNVFKFHEPMNYQSIPAKEWPAKKISSFVNCFTTDQLFGFDYALFRTIEREMFDWNFRAYGGQCRDGSKNGSVELAAAMAESRFIWHTKAGGDGFGHVIHNAAACGRPLIVRKEYYNGKMANDLLIDGETCIAIDGLSTTDLISKIEYYNQHFIYLNMCRAMRERFQKVVNFDKETEEIKAFLDLVAS